MLLTYQHDMLFFCNLCLFSQHLDLLDYIGILIFIYSYFHQVLLNRLLLASPIHLLLITFIQQLMG